MVKYVVFDGNEFAYADTVAKNDNFIKLTDFQYLSKGEPIPFAIARGEEAEQEVLDKLNFLFKHNATTTIFVADGRKFLDPAVAEEFGHVKEVEVSIPDMLIGDEVDAVIFSTALGEIMAENGFESEN